MEQASRLLNPNILAALSAVLMLSSAAMAIERSVTVPLKLAGNYPIFEADIDGHTIPLMFDLGEDSALVLTRAALEELKITPVNSGHAVSDVKGNTMESPKFTVRSLKIGGASFSDVSGRIDIHDPSYQSAHVGQLGYVGPLLVHDYRIVLDYRHGQMTLIPPRIHDAARAGCRGIVVPFLPEWDGAPVTKAHTDLGDLTVVWDTGAPISILRRAVAEQAHPNFSGQFLTTQHFRLKDTNFGPLELRVIDFSQPPGSDGFIGTNFFVHHVVCVDLPANRFLIHN